jgi:predicted AlkP superfamily pyrophosphatase or phosphodiesterase
MPDLSTRILPEIAAHQIENLSLADEMRLPFYEGLSLVNIPCTIARLLHAPDFGKAPLNDLLMQHLQGDYEKIILLLVDAMGYDLFNRMKVPGRGLAWGKYFDLALYTPLTSVCPSTTASALTTLWTGEGPGVHGIIGYEMWAKEYGMIMNNIQHAAASSSGDTGGLVRSGFDPYEFMDQPLLGTHLQAHGVGVTAFIHSSIAQSGLSTMQLRDVALRTYVDEADLCVSLADTVNSRRGIREYIYVYYSDVDTLMHRYNADDPRINYQFDAFSTVFEQAFLDNLSPVIGKDTLLILTADHGSKATPKYPQYDLAGHPDFLDMLVMQPTCENRLAFFYIKPGKIQAVRDYIEAHWPDDFILIESGFALESGLFGNGPLHPRAKERLGDLIAVAKRDAYLWWAPKPNPMAGRHGGLSDEEMLVPFYALPLGAVGR